MWRTREPCSGRTPSRISAGCAVLRTEAGRRLGAATRPPVCGGGLLAPALPPERNHARDLPLVPHVVDLGLEVLEVFLEEVGEAALLEEVLSHGLARPPFDDRLGLTVVTDHAVLDLVEGEDAGRDGQLAQLVAEHRVVVPSLRARVEGV